VKRAFKTGRSEQSSSDLFVFEVRSRVVLALAVALLMHACANVRVQPAPQAVEVVRIWPGAAPGTENWTGEEVQLDADLPAGRVNIVTNVTVPTLSIFRPPPGQANGTAVIVAPGGAFRALAWDLDGTEVARWLVARGITAFVLKYRVRSPQADETPGARFETARAIAIADAQQGLRLIRTNAMRYGIAADRIGIIGFSAGAVTAMGLALSADASVRPNFVISAYGGIPAGSAPVAGGPPVFIVAAQDDPEVPSAESVNIYQTWTRATLPAELHLYENGGHGFGMRPHNLPVDNWSLALEDWLAKHGYIAGTAGRK
jgi:acetyl esterase/lipase